jgi:hypothetical protein
MRTRFWETPGLRLLWEKTRRRDRATGSSRPRWCGGPAPARHAIRRRRRARGTSSSGRSRPPQRAWVLALPDPTVAGARAGPPVHGASANVSRSAQAACLCGTRKTPPRPKPPTDFAGKVPRQSAETAPGAARTPAAWAPGRSGHGCAPAPLGRPRHDRRAPDRRRHRRSRPPAGTRTPPLPSPGGPPPSPARAADPTPASTQAGRAFPARRSGNSPRTTAAGSRRPPPGRFVLVASLGFLSHLSRPKQKHAYHSRIGIRGPEN